MPNDPLDKLMQVARGLNAAQVALLSDMARALSGPVEEWINPDSDVLSADFAANFSNRLRIYHATNEEKFNKKAFEYALTAASRYAGSEAKILPNAVAPDADVEVDGVRFSLKTEAARSIRPRFIHISKFAEARWIRECRTPEDFARETKKRVPEHLAKYERIFTLRAFDVPRETLRSGTPGVRYELWEIPKKLLMRVVGLRAEDFSPPRGISGGSAADVPADDGKRAFKVSLDGSVEKVTLANIRTGLCICHGSWTVPIVVAEVGED